MARRIVFSALCGAGFTAFLSLLLNLPGVNLLAAILLMPGGLFQSVLKGADSPVALLSANFLVYSTVVLITASYSDEFERKVESRRPNLWFLILVGVLACMAFIPALSPLWPTGMTQLTEQEALLREQLPVGIALQQAREVLRADGIEFWEHVEKDDNVISVRPEGGLKAAAGASVLSAKVWTKARRFPCAYRIDIVLVFGREAKLTERSIYPHRICP